MKNLLLLLLCVFALSSSLPAYSSDSVLDSARYTFVIVHGATGGGWDWKVVDQKLSAKGHIVYRPTLTGLGEKFHLANANIDLTTHINDVVNQILFEQLTDVVLVGHSYGGVVITGVVDRIPERIRHATFLDATAPEDGMSALDVWEALSPDSKIENGLVYFPWLDEKAKVPKDVPHPYKTLTESVSYKNPAAKKVDVTFVAFVPEGVSVEERIDDPSWKRAQKRGWTMRTFDGDHVVYRVKPDEMAALLIDAVDDRNIPRSSSD